ncbi:hypothetical protein AAE02nite_11230 [Adhaeribacter aerolatus]|uniref:Uncharacterized protein n=1 Tax=Adhaeribacter aerolatus TaxID=670289 RepID=A0A512AUR4_9BACT|nr:hypothetical protein AAE02nite_11230 [Adhaeribacter aerolatus]
MKGKSFITKLESIGSLTQIIWAILGGLLLVYVLLTFSDSLLPNNSKVLNWGKVDLKSQLP